MDPNPEWVPDFEASEFPEYLEDAISGIDSETANQIGMGVAGIASSTSPIAASAIGIVSTTLASEWVKKQGGNLDKELQSFINEHEGSEDKKRAWGAKIAKGVSYFLPDGNELRESTAEFRRGNPDQLLEKLEEYHTDPKKRHELETTIEGILSGSLFKREDAESVLKDAFDAETLEEALAIFFDLNDILAIKSTYEYVDRIQEIDEDAEGIVSEVRKLQSGLENNLQRNLEIDLQNEGFYRITPLYYRRQPIEPDLCWQRPFNLTEVKEGFAVKREIEDSNGEKTSASSYLINNLQKGSSRFIVGSPGSGKSTICKRIANTWYDRQYGPVLYRPSGGFFGKTGTLRHRIEDLKKEGHVLVVIEDIARAQTKTVFEEIRAFADDPSVSFLADSRKGEFENIQSEFLVDESDRSKTILSHIENNVEEFEVPPIRPSDCKKIKERYENKTGNTVVQTGDELYQYISSENNSIGEMILLTYYLHSGLENGESSLEKDVRAKLEQIENYNQTYAKTQWSGVSHDNNELIADLALLINVLNATEIEVTEEVLHQFSDETRKVAETIDSFEGWLIFKSKESGNVYQAPHEVWSELYLQILAEENEQLVKYRFADCIESIFSLMEPEKSEKVRDLFPDSDYIRFLDDLPYPEIDFVTSLCNLGIRRPALEPIFTSLEPYLPDLDGYPLTVQGLALLYKSEMYNTFGDDKEKEEHLQKIIKNARQLDSEEKESFHIVLEINALTKLSTTEINRGNYARALDFLFDASDICGEVDDDVLESNVLSKIARIEQNTGNTQSALDYYVESYELIEDSDNTAYKANLVSEIIDGLFGRCKNISHEPEEREEEEFEADLSKWSSIFEKLMDEVLNERQYTTYYRDLARIKAMEGHYNEAKSLVKKSLEESKEKGDIYGEERARTLFGNVIHLKDIKIGAEDEEIEKALKDLNKAQEFYKEEDHFVGTIKTLTVKLYLQDEYSSDEEIRETCEEALEYIDTSTPESSREYLHDFSSTFHQRLAELEERHVQVRIPYKKGLMDIIEGDYKSAEKQLQEAWELREDHKRTCNQFGEANRAYLALISLKIITNSDKELDRLVENILIGRNRFPTRCMIVYDLLDKGMANPNEDRVRSLRLDNSIKSRISWYAITENLERIEREAFGKLFSKLAPYYSNDISVEIINDFT